MAHHGYLTIKGRTQGLISAGCSSTESIGNRCQTAHLDEIMVLSFSHNLTSIGNTEAAIHRPILITKYIDKSTPLLAEALTNREILQCKLKMYRINAGKHECFLEIELTDARVVDQRMEIPHSVLLSAQDPQEYLAIRYDFIAWHHLSANTSGYADWGSA